MMNFTPSSPRPAFAVAAILFGAGLLLSACTTQDIDPVTGMGATQIAPLKSDFGTPATRTGAAPVDMSKIRQYPLAIPAPTGAPQEILEELSVKLQAIAVRDAIPVTTAPDTNTIYSLKGYFSSLTEHNQTIVLYVWDIIDRQGNRVHRMQGQERLSGNGGWQAVNSQLLAKIADDTMAEYIRWLSASKN